MNHNHIQSGVKWSVFVATVIDIENQRTIWGGRSEDGMWYCLVSNALFNAGFFTHSLIVAASKQLDVE